MIDERKQKELHEELRALSADIRRLQGKYDTLAVELAKAYTDLAIGDTVEYRRCPGKGRFVITSVRAGYDFRPKFYGCKVKKDGTLGSLLRELWHGELAKVEKGE